ncbi:MAG: nucleotide exchange factor GrpE [Clostridia bacterium]|nr:nucleotide exchange factor GrpE [Clostridia bacterium]
MEDLEKENCGCCPEYNCGDECHCTPDNKCCDECTCDKNCKCDCNDNKCDDECKCDDNCDRKSVNNDSCDCDEHCTCGEECNCTEDDKCCEECDCAEDEKAKDDKCQCGCGESIEEETTADAYFKQLLSLRAEFDNYRKRTQTDISKAYSNGFNQAITEFLPALDSFKMATEYITDPNTLMGIQYIEKGILSTLEKMGIEVIDVSGKFDPDFHQAIGSEASDEHESGDIIKECFKGFKMGDKVIRYAQVIVAK